MRRSSPKPRRKDFKPLALRAEQPLLTTAHPPSGLMAQHVPCRPPKYSTPPFVALRVRRHPRPVVVGVSAFYDYPAPAEGEHWLYSPEASIEALADAGDVVLSVSAWPRHRKRCFLSCTLEVGAVATWEDASCAQGPAPRGVLTCPLPLRLQKEPMPWMWAGAAGGWSNRLLAKKRCQWHRCLSKSKPPPNGHQNDR